jgi:hypothetical protein
LISGLPTQLFLERKRAAVSDRQGGCEEQMPSCPVEPSIRDVARMEQIRMPVMRYFLFVGVALLALFFAVDAYLPKMPVTEAPRAAADLSVIRIHSVQKWPERVVIDTTLPSITPPATAMRVVNIPPASLAEAPEKTRVREALAQPQPADPKRPEARRKRRTIARGYIGLQPIRLAQQPRFGSFGNGFFGNNIW